MSRELATLQTNIEIPHNVDFYQKKEPDLEGLKDFYRDLNFHTFLKEAGESPDGKKKKRNGTKNLLSISGHRRRCGKTFCLFR
jgi:hypothetical protein